MNAEQIRLDEAHTHRAPWKKWGPYLSERQWGTVREDCSDDGNAWDYFSHDQARSRAYRWGEDGLAGISDDQQLVCFSLALWNGKDPILKERLFGLTNGQGNHGEDVKEYYFYLDSTPTHSYMKYLYKYPQVAYPYGDLIEKNRQRGRRDFEYELIDTGVFNDDRYFDVFVEYAKASAEDILIEITVHNRGPEAAELHVLPTLWFRNIWSWGGEASRPELHQIGDRTSAVSISHPDLGERYLHVEGTSTLLFTENDTNNARLFQGTNQSAYVKDGINEYIVHGHSDAVNPAKQGTKASVHYRMTIPVAASHTVRLRLNETPPAMGSANKRTRGPFGADFAASMNERRREADEFFATVIAEGLDEDQARVTRQALAGMLWTKQFFHYDVNKWLKEHGSDPFTPSRRASRNDHWHHMYNADIISMPDKWEYPWYAAWDLAFHVLALTMVDPDFGKQQLDLMLRARYMHPNGQIPAYEWNFGDVNPPVHAWATIFTYRLDKAAKGQGDEKWLQSSFQKLLLNFTWWVNRKDRSDRNAFEGGFLGLDNIGVFDRSAPLPTGGYLEQADGTAWMVLFCENMFEIAVELALSNPQYADMALKFVEHFYWIATAMTHVGDAGMWDEEDGFFYDVLRLPDGRAQRLKVRSMVGLLPLCAATMFQGKMSAKYPEVRDRINSFFETRAEIRTAIHDPLKLGVAGRQLASILDERKLRRVLAVMLDEDEFLSQHGIRSLSRYHAEHPFTFRVGDRDYGVGYLPGESDSGMFGGNSNWRGPIWLPVNGLIIRALLQYYAYFGDDFKVECPTRSGRHMTLYQVAEEITNRLSRIFLRDTEGRRPLYGGTEKFQQDPYWRDLILFYEYFHGDNGAGLGASHQTGWTGIIARMMDLFATTSPEQVLETGGLAATADVEPAVSA
ncbi:glucosidase [Rhizobium sp. IBUN]|uniref:MGH1-like glycoside hydrolase domain-containing protein n=1 Tax=Rhizobium sp. IBUN TaxID=1042326 RepID=UPI0004076058|nr:glucosidase [Rhizobium sp. IBUN]